MSVKSCEKLEKNEVALTVEVGAEAFQAAIEKVYRQKRKDIRVPGFRPGKASRQMIEKMYGEGVFFADAIDLVWFDAYREAVESENLQVVGEPKVEMVDEVTREGFTFKAVVPVYPEVTLGQYKGLSAPKAEVKITAADVNERVQQMAERNARLISAEDAIVLGDTAVIDYVGTDNGVAFDGGTAENYSLEIGSGSFVPGFEDQLIGMKAGEERDIDITFHEDYHADLAGKAVVFHVKVNEVKRKEIPEVDDEFAKDVSEFDTLKEMKADLKKKLAAEREAVVKADFENALMQQVADNLTVEIPDAMVETQIRQMMDNYRMQLQQQGIPYDKFMEITGQTEEQLRADAQEPALRQVKMDLAVAAIIKAESVECTAEEVEKEYTDLAEKYSMDVEMVKQYLPAETIEDQVKSRKAVAVVVDSAVATAPEAEEKPAKKTTKKSAKKEEE